MRLFSQPRRLRSSRLFLILAVLPMAGCIAHAPGSGGGGQKQIDVTITSSAGTPASVPVSTTAAPSTVQYTAAVTGASNTSVTWTLSAYSNTNPVCSPSGNFGTIATTGHNTMTYTAPTEVPVSPCSIVVTAVSDEDKTTSGSSLVNVHITLIISPPTGNMGQGANFQYTGIVQGAPAGNDGIVWSANCPSCPNQQTGGTFDVNNPGLFIAPGLISTVQSIDTTITATPNFDSQQAQDATMTVLKSDPLGTVTPSTAAAAKINCPAFSGGLSGATCYKVNVSCDAIADWAAYLKVNAPMGAPLGTVIFGTGSGGTTLYDNDTNFIVGAFNGGENVVSRVLNSSVADSGYTTVQVSFSAPFDTSSTVENGWLQGPGGVRRLACRYASIADWVYKNIHNSNTTAPFCATGNSAGSAAIGYAATEYGLASEFSLLELTGGPVMTFLHQGCNVCGQFQGGNPCTEKHDNLCFSAGGPNSTAGIIDTAYQAHGQSTPTLCTNGVNGDNSNFSRFLSDSIEDDPGISPALPIPNPPTNVNVVFGTKDATNAVAQGYVWWGGLGPPAPIPACIPDAAHAIPAVQDGADQIVADIKNMCQVH